MKKHIGLYKILVFLIMGSVCTSDSFAQDKKLVVRIAKLQIHPAQLEKYTTELKEEIETSVRVEPGVLSLYAVADKANPASIIIFEIYANEAAYNSHRETPHFKKYKTGTSKMIKSLELLDTAPIALKGKKELRLE